MTGRMTTACEWCGRAIVPDHDGRWLRAKPPFEVECDASEDGWHSPAAPGREPTRSLQEAAEELGIPPEEIPTVDPATFRSWQEGREASAEREGRVAYQAGVPQHQNPYAATFAQSEARLAWLTGWLAAEGREAAAMPRDVATTLLRALVWCGDQITAEQREQAWAWVEDARGPVEEMGQ